MKEARISQQALVMGDSFNFNLTIEATKGNAFDDDEVAVAKQGNLTVRGNATAGNLTMGSGHGITTGNRLDLYFDYANGTPGFRRGVIAGTVASLTVPISGGGGDDLPPASTLVIASIASELDFVIPTGADAQFLGVSASSLSQVVFAWANGTEIVAYQLDPSAAYFWAVGLGANPLGTATVSKAYYSQSGLTTVSEVKSTILYNN